MTRSLTYTKHKVPYINRPFLRKQLTFCEQSLPTYCVHQKTSAARQFIHTQNFIEQKENGKKTLLSHTLSHSHVQLVSLDSRALRWHFLRCIRDAAHQFAQLYKSQQHNASACYIAITLSDKMKNYAIVPSCERDNKAAVVPDNQPKPTDYYSRLLRPTFRIDVTTNASSSSSLTYRCCCMFEYTQHIHSRHVELPSKTTSITIVCWFSSPYIACHLRTVLQSTPQTHRIQIYIRDV